MYLCGTQSLLQDVLGGNTEFWTDSKSYKDSFHSNLVPIIFLKKTFFKTNVFTTE
jgi:hypothetical protein